jgi:hypothetical protein
MPMEQQEEEMSEEMYELYKNDPDFKRYVDAFCKPRGLSIFEAFLFRIIIEYADYLKKTKEGRI